MTEHLNPNDHGLNYREAYVFLCYSAGEAEWEGDFSLAENLRKQGAYYKSMIELFDTDSEYSAQCFAPYFENKFWNSWRQKNGITAWEQVARNRDQWNTTNPSGRL
jgi:hypothetical protein